MLTNYPQSIILIYKYKHYKHISERLCDLIYVSLPNMLISVFKCRKRLIQNDILEIISMKLLGYFSVLRLDKVGKVKQRYKSICEWRYGLHLWVSKKTDGENSIYIKRVGIFEGILVWISLGRLDLPVSYIQKTAFYNGEE